MKPLTTKQCDILNFIMDHVEQNGYPPSIREMMTEFRYKALKGVTNQLDALDAKGYIVRGTTSRAIKVLMGPDGIRVIHRLVVDDAV